MDKQTLLQLLQAVQMALNVAETSPFWGEVSAEAVSTGDFSLNDSLAGIEVAILLLEEKLNEERPIGH